MGVRRLCANFTNTNTEVPERIVLLSGVAERWATRGGRKCLRLSFYRGT